MTGKQTKIEIRKKNSAKSTWEPKKRGNMTVKTKKRDKNELNLEFPI